MFFLLYWKQIIAGSLLVILTSSAYFTGRNHGFSAAEEKYTAVIVQYQNQISNQITNLESMSNLLVKEGRDSAVVLKSGIDDVLKQTKGKPLTIIKNGECNPSQTFSDTFGKVNQRVNETLKDKKQ